MISAKAILVILGAIGAGIIFIARKAIKAYIKKTHE